MQRMLPQERLTERILFLAPWGGTTLSLKELEEMMLACNLKCRRGKTATDLRLALGRACKGTYGSTKTLAEQTAEEIDKVLTIRDWELAVGLNIPID